MDNQIFQKILPDLKQVNVSIILADLTPKQENARKEVVSLCRQIVNRYDESNEIGIGDTVEYETSHGTYKGEVEEVNLDIAMALVNWGIVGDSEWIDLSALKVAQ